MSRQSTSRRKRNGLERAGDLAAIPSAKSTKKKKKNTKSPKSPKSPKSKPSIDGQAHSTSPQKKNQAAINKRALKPRSATVANRSSAYMPRKKSLLYAFPSSGASGGVSGVAVAVAMSGGAETPSSALTTPVNRKSARRSKNSTKPLSSVKDIKKAIEEEMQYITEDVPYFKDLLKKVHEDFSKRSKNISPTLVLNMVTEFADWIVNDGQPAIKELETFKTDVEEEIGEMLKELDKLTDEKEKLELLYQELMQENTQLAEDMITMQNNLEAMKARSRHEEMESQGLELQTTTIVSLEAALDEAIATRNEVENDFDDLRKEYNFVKSDLVTAVEQLRKKDARIDALEDDLGVLARQMKETQKRYSLETHSLRKQYTELQIAVAKEKEEMEHEHGRALSEMQQLAALRDSPAGENLTQLSFGDTPTYQPRMANGIHSEYDGLEDGGFVQMTLEDELNTFQYEDDRWLSESEEQTPAPMEVEMEFASETTRLEVEDERGARQSGTFEAETMKISVEKENKEEKFESESRAVSVEPQSRQNSCSLQLEMSQMHTPVAVSDDDEELTFASGPRLTFEEAHVPKKKATKEFKAETVAVEKKPVKKRKPPPPMIPKAPKEQKSYEDGISYKSTAFAKLMSGWQKKEEEKGGVPKVAPIYGARTSALIDKWAKHKPSDTLKTVKGGDSRQQALQQIAVDVKGKRREHTMKPRWSGYLTIRKSSIVPDMVLKKRNGRFFFCLDGLPKNTNVKNEPEFLKNRKNQPLVPSLFFFENESDYKELARTAGGLGTRTTKFQARFAQFARGIFQLDCRVVGTDQQKCITRLEKEFGFHANIPSYLVETSPAKPDKALYCVGKAEATWLEASSKEQRDKWVAKIEYLQRKRKESSFTPNRPRNSTLQYHKISLVETHID